MLERKPERKLKLERKLERKRKLLKILGVG